MNHFERVEASIAREAVDRPAVALWRHFPVDDQSPDSLAAANIEFHRLFDFDLLKITPASSFCIKDWGAEDEWRGATEGTREYTRRVIRKPGDWLNLSVLDPKDGFLAAQLECLRIVVDEVGQEVPVIQTVFNPLAQAKNLVGAENLAIHLRQYPRELKQALQVIALSIQRFVHAAGELGAAGIFYAVQHAQLNLFSQAEYEEFGRTFDMLALESARDLKFNMLHLHGTAVMFDLFLDYPVGIINWHDRETPPSLSEAKERFSGALCGGLRRQETMLLGDSGEIRAETEDAIQQTGGRGLILGTGCVIPTNVPRGNIVSARNSVEK